MPPSPVLCKQPASAQPEFIATVAAELREPKLIAETLMIDSGWKAPRRPRAAPSTFAHGSGWGGLPSGGSGGSATGNVECFRIR